MSWEGVVAIAACIGLVPIGVGALRAWINAGRADNRADRAEQRAEEALKHADEANELSKEALEQSKRMAESLEKMAKRPPVQFTVVGDRYITTSFRLRNLGPETATNVVAHGTGILGGSALSDGTTLRVNESIMFTVTQSFAQATAREITVTCDQLDDSVLVPY